MVDRSRVPEPGTRPRNRGRQEGSLRVTPERWLEVKEALGAFLELGPEERPAYLGELRRRDPDLADEVADLAEWDEQTGAALEPTIAVRAALEKGSKLF